MINCIYIIAYICKTCTDRKYETAAYLIALIGVKEIAPKNYMKGILDIE